MHGGIERILAAKPNRKPVELLALLELLNELCTQSGLGIKDKQAREYLAGITGSGKSAKLAKAILAIGDDLLSTTVHQAAALALQGRIERAERWQSSMTR